MDDKSVVRIKMVQHNIGRKQNYNNQIVHKDANRQFFRRTVKNYLALQIEKNHCDVYTLQEVSLESNIELTPHIEDLLRKNTSSIQYSKACGGIYIWFTPAYEHESPTFIFLSEPFRINSRRFQYMYAKTSVGLQYRTHRDDVRSEYHNHGVAVVYDLDVFSLQQRTRRNVSERSIYNLLYDNIRSEKLALIKKKAKMVRLIETYRIPKVRYSPVVILRHLNSNYNFGFISFHGKIVSLRKGNGYHNLSDINDDLNFYHDTYKIRRQLHKEYPVFLGADINVDLCNTSRYFDHYNKEYRYDYGFSRAKQVFLKHFKLYQKSLAQNDIAIYPSPKDGRCSYTETNTRNFKTLIDYIMFHNGSMIKYSDIKISRKSNYVNQKNNSDNDIFVNDFDHMPLVMDFHAPIDIESFSSLDKSAQLRYKGTRRKKTFIKGRAFKNNKKKVRYTKKRHRNVRYKSNRSRRFRRDRKLRHSVRRSKRRF